MFCLQKTAFASIVTLRIHMYLESSFEFCKRDNTRTIWKHMICDNGNATETKCNKWEPDDIGNDEVVLTNRNVQISKVKNKSHQIDNQMLVVFSQKIFLRFHLPIWGSFDFQLYLDIR